MTDYRNPTRTRRSWRVRLPDGTTVELYTETAARLRASLDAERDPRAPAPIVEHLEAIDGEPVWLPAIRPEAAMLAVAEPGPTARVSGVIEAEETARNARRPERFIGRPASTKEGTE